MEAHRIYTWEQVKAQGRGRVVRYGGFVVISDFETIRCFELTPGGGYRGRWIIRGGIDYSASYQRDGILYCNEGFGFSDSSGFTVDIARGAIEDPGEPALQAKLRCRSWGG